MSNDPTRLRANGFDITLLDGTKAALIFDFAAICVLEELMGSMANFATRLAQGSKLNIAQTVAAGVTAALQHTAEPPSLEEVVARLDLRRINEYVDALDDAFAQAMPEASDDPKAPEEAASPGTTSTTSRPSATDEPTPSSGE